MGLRCGSKERQGITVAEGVETSVYHRLTRVHQMVLMATHQRQGTHHATTNRIDFGGVKYLHHLLHHEKQYNEGVVPHVRRQQVNDQQSKTIRAKKPKACCPWRYFYILSGHLACSALTLFMRGKTEAIVYARSPTLKRGDRRPCPVGAAAALRC